MNYRSLLLSLVASGALCASAHSWTLEECIDYAIENNISVKSSRADLATTRLGITEAKSGYLPRVNASASESWNIGRGLTAENTYADRNTSSFSWNLGLSLPLFTGLQNERRLALAKADLVTAVEQLEAVKEDVTLNVIASYLQVLYTKELNEVALRQVELSEYELSRRKALLAAGKIPEADMLDAESQLAQDRLSATQTANDVRLATLDLAQLLEVPFTDDFDVSPLTEEAKLVPDVDEIYTRALLSNHSLRAARSNIVSAEKNVTLSQSGYLPTLSFSAGIGSSYYTLSGANNPSFGRQMKNNYATYFGLSLNIPLFDALSTHNSVRRAKANLTSARLRYDEQEQRVFKAIRQAYYQADGARHKLEAAEVADNAAQAAFTSMQEKYNLGRATPTEYEQAKLKATRTAAECIQARYELILRTRILAFYGR